MSIRLAAVRLCCVAWTPFAVAQVKLEFGTPTAIYRSVVQLQDGSRLLIGSMQRANAADSSSSVAALTFLGSPGAVPPNFGGGGKTIANAAAVDPSGNIWIGGATDSEDFRLVNPIFAKKVPYRYTGFVVELDPTGSKLLFSTFLGGQSSESSPVGYTKVTALAIDGAGNVYVGGDTGDVDFPRRGGFDGCRPYYSPFGDRGSCSFAVKFTAARTLAYSTMITSQGGCTGSNSGCIGRNSRIATVDSMAVDSDGAVTIGGALGSTFDIRYGFLTGNGYICRIAADGSKLVWNQIYAAARQVLVALDPSGGVVVFGRAVPGANVFPPSPGTPTVFAARVRADGSGFAYQTVLGRSDDAGASGILVDKTGDIYLAGTSSSLKVPPGTPGLSNPGSDFLLRLDPSGSLVRSVLRLPRGTINGPPSFDGSGVLMLPGARGALLSVPSDYSGLGPPAIVGFANAASFAPNTGLFPGALLSLYGFNLPAVEQGLRVQVNGQTAPILYAGPNQVNLQVPFKIPMYPSYTVTVSLGNLSVQAYPQQSIGIFTLDGVHAAALNQDGSVNSQANPAASGSVVSLFGTGAAWPSGMVDGAAPMTAQMLDPNLNRFEALNTNQTPLAILYAGAAPGIVNGVFQVNILLPPSTSVQTRTYGIVLQNRLGMLPGNTVQVYVK